jgi:hypothetical protein
LPSKQILAEDKPSPLVIRLAPNLVMRSKLGCLNGQKTMGIRVV